jgi:phospholipid transport system transporter-binding protein
VGAHQADFEFTGDAGHYRLGGAAGYGNARLLLEAGRRRLGSSARADVDLSGLTALDSAGLAVLITWLAEARGAGRELAYRDLPASLVATARVAGVESLLAGSAA